MRELPARGVVIFEGDTDRDFPCEKFSVLVFVPYQPSGKFCFYLNMTFSAMLPEHRLLHTPVVQVLHSVVGKN
jgi:hypothetical protein